MKKCPYCGCWKPGRHKQWCKSVAAQEIQKSLGKITIPLDYAGNIVQVLENHVSMGFEIVSKDIKDIVSEEAYKKLQEIFYKYHNANCNPFNRVLKTLIKEAKVKV